MSSGYIMLWRQIQDNSLWISDPFSRGQAWIDLLLLANHKQSYYRKRGIRVDLKRGQLGRSIVELADRWGWSRGKVKRFLDELEVDQQIEQQKNEVTTLITIKNYDKYNSKPDNRRAVSNTADEQQADTYKNDNNEKNEKKVYVAKDFNLQNCRTKASLLKYVNKMEMPAKNKENLQYIVMAAVKEQNYNPFEIQELIEKYTYEEEKPVNSRRNVRRV